MQAKITELKTRLAEIYDLDMAGSLLGWDQQVNLPPGGAAGRGRQSALLARLSLERSSDPALGRLLDELQPYAESLPYDSDDASLVRVARREFERAIRIPPEFMSEFYQHSALCYQAWTEARPAGDFKKVEPFLERTLDLSRRMAMFFPGYEHIADPLIDFSDYGMKAASVSALFAELRAGLVPLVQAITARPPVDDTCLHRHFPRQAQWDFGTEVIRDLGYDFNRGRQDFAPHPFTTKFGLGDVRITTRIDEDYLADALFSTIHEAGHAMYEQGIRMDLEGTPLASGTSAGVHESQSRLWENIVGRSLPFWRHYYPRLQATFPVLTDVSLEDFYRAINKVQRSLVRVDADEVTYNLHVMLRFDLELELLEGQLAVRDLPEAWRSRFAQDLGITPPDDRLGVLQDVHWYGGIIGGSFQGYTIGNILSVLWYRAALQAHPEIPAEMEEGRFGTLHGWLVENIYQHGRKFTANELVERVTGGPMQIEPYLAYLREKYAPLYGLA